MWAIFGAGIITFILFVLALTSVGLSTSYANEVVTNAEKASKATADAAAAPNAAAAAASDADAAAAANASTTAGLRRKVWQNNAIVFAILLLCAATNNSAIKIPILSDLA